MALPKASIANSASFQISGIPFIKQIGQSTTETIDFKYVTKAVAIIAAGDDVTIHFGDVGSSAITLIANTQYRFEVKSKKMVVVTPSDVNASVVAELTGVESGQLAQHTQADWATVT